MWLCVLNREPSRVTYRCGGRGAQARWGEVGSKSGPGVVWCGIQRLQKSHVLDHENSDQVVINERWRMIAYRNNLICTNYSFQRLASRKRSQPIRDLVYTVIVLPWSLSTVISKNLVNLQVTVRQRQQPLNLNTADIFRWKWTADGQFTTASAYRAFFLEQQAIPGAKELTKTRAPGQCNFFFLACYSRSLLNWWLEEKDITCRMLTTAPFVISTRWRSPIFWQIVCWLGKFGTWCLEDATSKDTLHLWLTQISSSGGYSRESN